MNRFYTMIGVCSTLFVTLCVAGGSSSKEAKVQQQPITNQFQSVIPVANSSCVLSSVSSSSSSSLSYSESNQKVLEGYLATKVVAPHSTGGILLYPSAKPSSVRLGTTDSKGVKIKLSEAELKKLKEVFDDKLLTPDGSNKNLRFIYKHIFNASTRRGKHVGHYDPKGQFSVGQKKASPGIFPHGWTPEQIMTVISTAYNQRDNNGQRDRNEWIVIAKTFYKFKIKLVFDLDKDGKCTGKVKTAYPIK